MQNSLFQPSSHGDFYWVHGEDVARSYPQPNGTTALFLDTEDPVFFIKTLDINGQIQNFEVYDYTKREPPAPPSYATKEDLASVASQIASLQKMLEDLTAPSV
jgi:hypothetical protein